jgi:hypothetical protein
MSQKMIKISLKLQESKLEFLLKKLEELSFVEIENFEKEENNDWWDDLSATQKESIEKSVLELNKGNFLTNEDVRKKVKKLFNECL